jgi:mandelate racemase
VTREALIVRSVRATPVVLPLPRPMTTAAGTIPDTPLLLIDLETEQGVTGRSYLFCYHKFLLGPLGTLVQSLGEIISSDPLAPLDLDTKLRRVFVLFGDKGLATMAMSGIDMAAWDALAVAAGLPLAEFLGGTRRRVRTYLSLPMLELEEAKAAAIQAADEGWSGLKIKIGWPRLMDDIAVVRAVRSNLPDEMALMVDYNQTLSVAEAVRRATALDSEGLTWIEEPVRATDFQGLARVAAEIRTPIQIGENLMDVFEMAEAFKAEACDLVMPDLAHIGGVTGWQRAASLAQLAGKPCSGHVFIEASSHMLSVTPTCDWLEWSDMASPLITEPLLMEAGHVMPSGNPGTGIEWDRDAIQRFKPPGS